MPSSQPRPTTVIVVEPTAGPHLSVVGDTYHILVHGRSNDNAFAQIDMHVPPGAGPAPHAHADVEETFFVVEGEVVFRSETQHYTAKQGSFVHIPKGGAIHSFTNESGAPARLLCTVVPAGLEQLFEDIGKPVAAGTFLPAPEITPAVMEELKSAAKRHGMEVFPPDFLSK